MFRARLKDTESLEREHVRLMKLILDQPPDQPRPALGRRPWFALLRRARSLRRFAFAMRRESVARSGHRLTLRDPKSGWMVHRVTLLTGLRQRWRGAGTGVDRVLMRTSQVHGRSLEVEMLVVGLDSTGHVIGTKTLLPGHFLRIPGAMWVLELPDGEPRPVFGARLDLYARQGERQTDPLCNTYWQPR